MATSPAPQTQLSLASLVQEDGNIVPPSMPVLQDLLHASDNFKQVSAARQQSLLPATAVTSAGNANTVQANCNSHKQSFRKCTSLDYYAEVMTAPVAQW